MLKYPLLVAIALIPQLTLAYSSKCGEFPKLSGGVRYIDCWGCNSISDFARSGAAYAHATGLTSIEVKDNRGNQVTVNAPRVLSGPNLGPYGYYPFFPTGDRRVSAYVSKGSVSGGTWGNVLVRGSALKARCQEMLDKLMNGEDDNGNIGEGSSAGRGGYVGQGFDWTGLSLDRFTNTRTGAVYNQFAYRGRIDRGLTLGHRTAIVRDTETNPRTGETYENEYRTDYLCGQRAYKCNANVKQK